MTERTTLIRSKTEAVSARGMVATESAPATDAGVEIFERGGNAVDAAVAASFAAAVCEPAMTSIGGGGAVLVYQAKTGKTAAIEFNGRLPSAAHEDMFVGDLLPKGESLTPFGWRGTRDDVGFIGYRSLGVPGQVAGVAMLLERFGTMPLADVLVPAIRLAEDGYDVNAYYALAILDHAAYFKRFPPIDDLLLPGGFPPRPSHYYRPKADRIIQPELARTLRKIADGGPDAFYRGEIARAIIGDVRPHGAIVTTDDYAKYEPRYYEDGLRTTYRGCTVVAMPDAFGGVTVLETLNLLEGFDLRGSGHNSSQTLHLLIEALRLAWTDRFGHMGDPEFEDVPIAGLISKVYAAERRRALPTTNRPDRVAPGDPWLFQAASATPRVKPGGAHPPGNETSHLVAADAEGNLVSLVQTLGGSFGANLTSPSTGIIQRNYTNLFNPEPGTKNSLGPWKRPLSHDSLVLVLKDGRPFLALGAPGGRRVIPAVVQVLLNVIDFDLGIQDAIAAPRIHVEGSDPKVPAGSLTPRVWGDSRLDPATIRDLERRGHEVELLEDDNFALPVAILREVSGTLHGGVTVPVPATARGL